MSDLPEKIQGRKQKRRDLFETAPLSRNLFKQAPQLELYNELDEQQNNKVEDQSEQMGSSQNLGLQKYKQDEVQSFKMKRELVNESFKIAENQQTVFSQKKQEVKGFIFEGSSSSEQEEEVNNQKSHHRIIFEDDIEDQTSNQNQKTTQIQTKKTSKTTIQLFGEKVQIDTESVENNQNLVKERQNKNQQPPKKQILKASTIMPANTFAKLLLIRNKSTGIFSLCLESNKRLIFSCKNISGQTYHIVESIDFFEQNGPTYVGKVKGSFFGNEVNYFTRGLNPQKAKDARIRPRQLICTIVSHSLQIMEQVKPRDFTVYYLKPEVNYYDLKGVKQYEEEVPLNKLFHEYDSNRDKIHVYDNRKSKWNQKEKMYSLNMKGRAKVPSIKNFILESLAEEGRQIFLLGKVQQNQFSFDIHHPMSPAVAMAIALTSFIHKSW